MRRNGTFSAVLAAAVGLAAQWACAQGVVAPPSVRTQAAETAPASDHDGGRLGRLPIVTSIAFSPDGRHLAASYYVPAINRPGTDWRVWAAQWDLSTGKRLVLPNAFGPIAFSPDGKMIAMCPLEPTGPGQARMLPRVRRALWTPGADKPDRILSHAGEDLISLAFHPGGRCLVGMTASGQLVSWLLDKDEPPKPVDKVDFGFGTVSWWGAWPRPAMLFSGRYELLALLGWRGEHLSWAYNPDSNHFGAQTPLRLSRRNTPATVTEVALLLSPDRRLLAFSGCGKVVLNDGDGNSLRMLPAGGAAVAFSPDGELLAAGDNRGIIRLWDVKTGALVRTLRLDDRPGNAVLVAAVQCPSAFGDVRANRQRLERLVAQAAGSGASIIVLPEAAVTGYLTDDLGKTWQVGNRAPGEGLTGVDPKEAAETVPGESTDFFGRLADQCGIYLTVPLVETDRKTGRYYNTSVLLGPDGRILIHYRKRDPWPWAETSWAAAGDRGNPVVDTPFGRLGLLICYDIHQQAAVMGGLKVDTLLYSIAWVERKDSDWFPARLPQIARANGLNIVAANWTVASDKPPAWHGYGQSRIITAGGEVLAKAGDDLKEEIVYAELPIPARQQEEPPPKTAE